MADIKVVIQLQDTMEDNIESLGTSSAVNNASIQTADTVFNNLSTKSNGTNMKSWATGSLLLTDGVVGGANTRLIEQYGYNGYVFGAVSKDNKLTVTLEVHGENIDSIVIYGDKNANQFPTKAYRDGDTTDIIYSDDATWAIKFDTASSVHTITFLEWNRADYNACITYVGKLSNELVLDKSWIKSVESLSQSTGQPKEVYYGVTPSSGSLDIIDKHGELKDYLQEGIIVEDDLKVDLVINGKILQKQFCETVDYNLDDKSMSIDLTSSKEQSKVSGFLDKTLINKNIRDYTDVGGITLKQLLVDEIFGGDNIDDMLQEKTYMYGTNEVLSIDEYLQKIKTNYFYLIDYTNKDLIDAICNVAQVHFVQTSDGKYKFISARPINSYYKPIKINKNQMFSTFRSDVVVRNKYNKVVINQTDIVKVEDLIYSKEFTIREEGDYTGFTTKYLGLDSVILNPKLPWIDVKPYVQFSEGVKYSKDLLFTITDNCIVKYSMTTLNQTGMGSTHTRLFEFPLSLEETSGQKVYHFLNDAQSPHDNNQPYVFSFSIDLYPYNDASTGVNYWTNSIKLDIVGATVYKTNFQEISYGEGDNIVNIQDNLLLHNNTWLETDDGTEVMTKVVADNILSDYKHGIKTATIRVGCLDYYYQDGAIAKKWANGEILDVGDIVSFEGESGNWVITSRKFVYSGVPMIDLDLREVKEI